MALKHPEPDVRYAALTALYQVERPVSCRSGSSIPGVMASAMEDSSDVIVAMNLHMFGRWGAGQSPSRRDTRRSPPRSPASEGRDPRPCGRPPSRPRPRCSSGTRAPEQPQSAPGPDVKAFVAELAAHPGRSVADRARPGGSSGGLPCCAEAATPKLVAMLDDTASVSRRRLRPALPELGRSRRDAGPRRRPGRARHGRDGGLSRALMLRSLYEDAKAASNLKCDDPAKTFAACAARARAWGRRAAGNRPAPKAP